MENLSSESEKAEGSNAIMRQNKWTAVADRTNGNKFLVKSYTRQNKKPSHTRALTNQLTTLYDIPKKSYIHHTGEEPKESQMDERKNLIYI